MQKVMLMVVLAVASSNALAEWVRVTANADNGLTVYADPSSISKSGNTVTMWSLYDFKTAQVDDGSDPYFSTKFQNVYDCKRELRQVLELSNFSGNMGNGEVLFSYHDTGKWTLFELESVSEYLWKYACREP